MVPQDPRRHTQAAEYPCISIFHRLRIFNIWVPASCINRYVMTSQSLAISQPQQENVYAEFLITERGK